MASRSLANIFSKSFFEKLIRKNVCFISFRMRSSDPKKVTKNANSAVISNKTAGKPIKCKAAVKWEQFAPFAVEEVEVAPPKDHEVRVKIVASGVSRTDDYNFGGFDRKGVFPVIRGHEGSGIVESIGKGVSQFKPGDTVIPIHMPKCMECPYCLSKKTNFCSKFVSSIANGVMPDGTTRFKCKGKPVYHFMGTSTFSQYTVLAEAALCKIDQRAPLDMVCLLGGSVATGYGAALNDAKVEEGSTCGIFGLGAVGMAAIMGCKRAGAKKIYGIDPNPARCELGKVFGLTDFVLLEKCAKGKSFPEHLRKLTKGGFDYSFACVGNVQAMRDALESTHPAWGVSVIAGIDSSSNVVQTKPASLLLGRTWKGSAFGGWNAVDDIPKLVKEYVKGTLLVSEYVTHTMTLDGINEAFKLMDDGKSLHSVLLMNC